MPKASENNGLENHCIFSIGIHNGYIGDEVNGWIHKQEEAKKVLKRDLKISFISPPSLSFAHGLQYQGYGK